MSLKDMWWTSIITLISASTIFGETASHPDTMIYRKVLPLKYIAVDPGVNNFGWCRWDEDGEIKGFGSIKGKDKFFEWLDTQRDVEVLIIEGYFVNSHKHRQWSPARTSENIGAIKHWAGTHNVKVVEQRNTDLSTGLKYIGMWEVYYDTKTRKQKKHVDDEIAAMAHGTVYLTRKGIIKNANAVRGQ